MLCALAGPYGSLGWTTLRPYKVISVRSAHLGWMFLSRWAVTTMAAALLSTWKAPSQLTDCPSAWTTWCASAEFWEFSCTSAIRPAPGNVLPTSANGLLRQYFPKGADLRTVGQAEVRFAADEINGRPRAVLDWDSAAAWFATRTAPQFSRG